MKDSQTDRDDSDFFELLPQAISRLKKNIFEPFFGESSEEKNSPERPPMRSEIFTKEKLAQHAVTLARRHVLTYQHASEKLLKRLADNEHILLEVYTLVSDTLKQNKPIAPAAEWLLDNFYLIEEQIYTGKKHLPKNYSKQLPWLSRGASAGLPRVYDMAVELISHSDGHIDITMLKGFVSAYQTVSYIKLGELWAIPIMLRLALIENLRRLAILIAEEINNKYLANKWADEMIEVVEKDPKNLVLVLADMARSDPPMVSTFVAEFVRKLQEKGSLLSLPLNWIEQRLSEMALTSNELIRLDNRNQAATQVSVSNSISSLRFLNVTNWREFVEDTSMVEATLRRDINGIYQQMDFYTRDQYRHAVEKIAKTSVTEETKIAEMAIDAARQSHAANKDPRRSHVGYYLIDKGFGVIVKNANAKTAVLEKCGQLVRRFPLFMYLGGICLLSFLPCWLLIPVAATQAISKEMLLLTSLISFIATTRLSVALMNWLSTILIKPRLLPRMDYSKGVPSSAKSLVVIPTLVNDLPAIDQLVEGLEVRYLANKDENLRFALLTDFKDAPAEHQPDDPFLLLALKNKIIELNKKYQRPCNDTFFLFHRPRRWNRRDKIWMGYERKRGKLVELNALLCGKENGYFSEIIADPAAIQGIKYIITLDADTQLPRDAAWKMIGTMAHPLNRPLYSNRKKRVVEGYGILQPRVSNSLPTGNNSIYARLHNNEPGTDPYTKATSDVYQDLFHEGSFIGKGIYDIDAFDKVIKDRFPENRILSHDLLEGCYVRSGLINDVQLYEEYPLRYDVDMSRRHRWIRGDWQIAMWVLPLVPGQHGKLQKNPLSLFSKWKIFDNLRRSLVPPCLLLLLLFGWTLSVAWFWTVAVSVIIILPAFVNFIWELSRKPVDVSFRQHLVYTTNAAFNSFVLEMLDVAFLPYEAFSNTDAIARTLWRMYISRRNLLQWNAYSALKERKNTIPGAFRTMWFEPVFAVMVYSYLTIFHPSVILWALPFLSIWMAGPLIEFAASRPVGTYKLITSEEEILQLQMLARKIWGFFEKFVTEGDNWLPPDNYQENPVKRTAHRTSPTNIGLALLSNLTAYDFGFITMVQFVERTSNTLSTLQRMERYRGHLYNWYDTITLNPLYPKYISTVDSGNLAGHLTVLKQGLVQLPDARIVTDSFFQGVAATASLLVTHTARHELVVQFRDNLVDIRPLALTLQQTRDYIEQLETSCTHILIELDFIPGDPGDTWSQKLLQQITEQKKYINSLVPWLLFSTVPPKFTSLIPEFPAVPTLRQIALVEQSLLQKIVAHYQSDNTAAEDEWLTTYRSSILEASRRAKEMIITLEQMAVKCLDLSSIDFDFLFDKSQHLLSIGYHPEQQRCDNSFYDLLASEARLTTYVGIAQGKLPQESWFSLGRQLTHQGTQAVLLSWSGSMFEYLMPMLVMPSYENTLLEQTNKIVVQKQIDYGKKRNVPWGISESGYYMFDNNLNFQYRAFGIPGIGFKRGLGEDLVISPYSTILALMIAPKEAYKNLRLLQDTGYEGEFGFYEAIDFTLKRLQRKQKRAVVTSFMAHHQGMSLLALSYVLLNRPMQQRFESEVHLKSSLLLLQEKIPRLSTFYSPSIHTGDINLVSGNDLSVRVINTPHTPAPEIQLLSNGRYHVMVTNAGGGYSRWKDLAITRWREDTTCDNWGNFCYIRDLGSNLFWSSAFHPSLQTGENYEAVFSQGRAEFRRRDFSLETHTEIAVSPEDDIELRRVHIANHSRRRRTLEITSYGEVVLAPQAADEIHPAFSNLFVQTEIYEQRQAILCSRRPRGAEEKNPWMLHLMKVRDVEIMGVSYETDRNEFIGRGNTPAHPVAMKRPGNLKGHQGSVLDPIVAIRYQIVLEGNKSATIDIITGVAETKEICRELIDKYQERHLCNRVLELSWTHSQVILRQLNASESDAQLYCRLAGSIVYSGELLRADPDIIIRNAKGQSGLWSYAISGDLPIILVQIEDPANISIVKQMIKAHLYWRLKGLVTDLVIWNDSHGGYRQQELHNQIQALIAPEMGNDLKEKSGGVFIRTTEQLSNEDRLLFQSVAHVIIADRWGTLDEQINRKAKIRTAIPYFSPAKFYPSVYREPTPPQDLQFLNGLGGFSNNGREYLITTNPENKTPAPWINVLANPEFGSIITENGQSYTWIDNAHEIRLTPWNNDPVCDLNGEAFYLKDEESGRFWSPTPLPCGSNTPYISRHGFGYSIFEHSEDGLDSEMTVFTDIEAPVKYIILKLRNHSGRHRHMAAIGYIEWVLGDLRPKCARHIITEQQPQNGALMARNEYNQEFAGRAAFFDVCQEPNKTITTDRTEFLGRNGTVGNPDALNRARLSGKTGAALDPCAVIHISFELSEDEEHTAIFRLGAGKNAAHTLQVIQATENPEAAYQALEKVHDFWEKTLGIIQVKTPDAAVNILANGWLNYQSLASRLFGRSGFYQSGGAFGFRDQLQDVLSLVYSQPQLVRSQVLLCASRQFREGDVQHWWHPPSGRGVRTTCSDDYLWLPYVTSTYINVSGDGTLLDEKVRFLEGRMLNEGEESYYDLPVESNSVASLYDHCVLAINHGLRFGEHGLPFMGSGDWNDGMDKVGNLGKGESVWLAFFLYDILMRFSGTASLRNDFPFAARCKEEAEKLRVNINRYTWDGQWYRRAYFDNGIPLGSHLNEECNIDSIAQSWAVLSKAGDRDRTASALQAAYDQLVSKEDGLIRLFNPPFDKSDLNPGYIKGYVPGVRENGGQYTHAAIWLVMAFAQTGNAQKTWELFQMINPINRSNSRDKIAIYKTEPYVIAADVYAEPLHKGHGGWTWYTGSAGWMYQLIINAFIGLKKEGNTLSFTPCIPREWESLELDYRFGETNYHIVFNQSSSALQKKTSISIDGTVQQNGTIPLISDGNTHQVTIELFTAVSSQ